MPELDDWIRVDEAPDRIGRHKATIYRWLADPDVTIRRMRPGKVLWLYLPDLLKVDAESIRGRGRHAENRFGVICD